VRVVWARLLWIGVAGADPGITAAEQAQEALRDRLGGVVVSGRADGGAGVVNGQNVVEGFDEVVALAGFEPNQGQAYVFCTGSLITDRWVLTAAHCIDGSRDVAAQGLDLVVLFGGDLLNVGYTEAIPWAQGIEDPSYNPSQFVNDAGLVELASAREGTRWMVLRDEPLDEPFVGTELTFFGFGVTRDNGTDSGIKRTTKIPVAGFDAFNIDTYDPNTNLCSGDSGGPSTFAGPKGPEQVGINAFVEGSCVGGRTGSTRVDNHIDWIVSHVPEVALDWADLPQPEVPGGPRDPGEGRPWDDLGADDVNGFGGQWRDGDPVARGCGTVPIPGGPIPGAPMPWGLLSSVVAAAAAARRRA
jgi:hypothetical protein